MWLAARAHSSFPLLYINAHTPAVVIIENVANLPTQHPEVVNLLTETLTSLQYTVVSSIVNTMDFGIPHSRRRWYCIAILTAKLRSTKVAPLFPDPVSCCVPLRSIIEPLQGELWKPHPDPVAAPRSYARAISACSNACAGGTDPFVTPGAVDTGCTEQLSHYSVDRCMRLARTRASTFGHWASTKGGLLSIAEM